MLEYLRDFFDEFEYEAEDRCALAIAYERIMADVRGGGIMLSLIRGYEGDTRYIKSEHLNSLYEIAKLTSVHPNTVIMLTVILLSKKMRERLLKLGLTKRVVYNTLLDLKYKLKEGKKLHGVVGFDKFEWYLRFLELRIFALGRLQFELRQYTGEPFSYGEREIKCGAVVLYTHIPRDDNPLDMKLANASFKEAQKVFSKLIGIEDIPILCSSWLLYPKNRELLPDNSNIVKFMDRFTLISVNDCHNNSNNVIPFVFEVRADTPIESLPENTTLQKGYKAHLLGGGKMGTALGLLLTEKK